MQENLYEIFGLSNGATDDEIDAKYKQLREKYRNDMFLEGAAGNEAARKLTELENAYSDILSSRSYKTSNFSSDNSEETNNGDVYKKVESLTKSGNINEAQDLLDNIKERTGVWHYYQAMVYYKKDWFTDSKKQLEIAINMEPDNEKYKTAKTRLEKLMSGEVKQEKDEKKSAEDWWKEQQEKNRQNNGNPDWEDNNRQMGGCDDSMSCCLNCLCLNAMCNCLGGGC